MENEKKLLLTSLYCWLAEANRLERWMANSRANRSTISKILTDFKLHKLTLERDPCYNDISEAVKQTIQYRWKKISKFSMRAKRLTRSGEDTFTTIQVPSSKDLQAMSRLPAGMGDDQKQRLKKLRKAVYQQFSDKNIIQTDTVNTEYWVDHLPWEILFETIRRNQLELVTMAFDRIAETNPLKQALLQAHERSYLLSVMEKCATLAPDEYVELTPGDTDVLVGQKSFEIFFRDLITTLEQRQKMNVSIGLPTHHAYRNKAAGFCLMNKLAVVLAYEQNTVIRPVHNVIIGLDVNRDDGLSSIIMNSAIDYSCTHFDVYDSRVYPEQSIEDIEAEWGWPATKTADACTWIKGNRCYKSIDLSQVRRSKPGQIHPAIIMILSELETTLVKAMVTNERVMIFLPTGWDSHVDEIAACGKYLNHQRWMSDRESKKCRFNDNDWSYFNRSLFELYKNYEGSIARIYWQLEGGYTDEVNVKQIACLAETLQVQKPKQVSEVSSSEASSSSGRALRPRRG